MFLVVFVTGRTCKSHWQQRSREEEGRATANIRHWTAAWSTEESCCQSA